MSNDAVTVPFVPSIGNYRFGTTLQDTPYLLDVAWNVTEQAWYFTVRESDQTIIQSNLKIVLGTYIGRRSDHPLFTQGVFVAIDLTNKGQEAGFDDLGTRVVVQYIPQLDLVRRIREKG